MELDGPDRRRRRLLAAAGLGAVGALLPAADVRVASPAASRRTETRGGLVGIYNGHGRDAEMAERAGVRFDLGLSYYNAGLPPLGQWDRDRLRTGTLPVIGMATKNFRNRGRDSFMTWAAIGRGDHDTELTDWGRSLGAYDKPMWFAFQPEPDVSLNRRHVPDDWTYDDYHHAYRRIVTVLRPLAPRLSFAYWVGGSDLTTVEALYPGDDVVDLIGWDPYVSEFESPSQTPYECWSPFLEWLTGRSWGQARPYGLFETGFDLRHPASANVAFWDAAPAAFRELGLHWMTLFNRDSGPNTHACMTDHPVVVDSYGEAMRAIQSGQA